MALRESMDACFSCVRPFVTSWTVVHQAPLSMGFSRQEYWSGVPCPPPGDLPDPGLNPGLFHLLHWQADSLPLASPGKPKRELPGRNARFGSFRVFTEHSSPQLTWDLSVRIAFLLHRKPTSTTALFIPVPSWTWSNVRMTWPTFQI